MIKRILKLAAFAGVFASAFFILGNRSAEYKVFNGASIPLAGLPFAHADVPFGGGDAGEGGGGEGGGGGGEGGGGEGGGGGGDCDGGGDGGGECS